MGCETQDDVSHSLGKKQSGKGGQGERQANRGREQSKIQKVRVKWTGASQTDGWTEGQIC